MAERKFDNQKTRSDALGLLGKYVCPRCETELEGDYCRNCDYRYPVVGGGE